MSARPHRFLHADGAGSLLSTRPMSLYDLMSQFWQLDAERPFTATETRLYFYWLHQFNAARWPESLPRRPLQVCADLTLTDKTLALARAGLVARGLLAYTEGHRRLSAVWGLPLGPPVSRNNSGLQPDSPPRKAGIIPGRLGADSPNSPQVSRNNSGGIVVEEKTILQDEEKTTTPFGRSDVAAGEEPGGLKKQPTSGQKRK